MKKYYGHTLLYLHETAAALSELGQICAADGLTGIYIGPVDLAISMGADVVGATRHPEVLNAIGRIHRVR